MVARPAQLSATEFAAMHPRLYHMAESGSWPSIEQHGLLSTEALLDLFAVKGTERKRILTERRAAKVVIENPKYGKAVIRDNLPMLDTQLAKCLSGGLKPVDWYQLLNSKVFFWVSEARLDRLLGARAYRADSHDVIVVDTASLVQAHANHVSLSPINSGATRPAPQPRGPDTFLPIARYPYSAWLEKRGAKGEPVVECAVDYAVTDIVDHTLYVERRQSGNAAVRIWSPKRR